MFGKMVDGLIGFIPSNTKGKYFFGGHSRSRYSGQSTLEEPPVTPSGSPAIGVNWSPESELACSQIGSSVSDSAKLRAMELYIRKNAHGFTATETTKETDVSEHNDEHEAKDRMMEIIDKLRDGLSWTVVECQGNEWYIPVKESPDELLETTMTGWAIHAAESTDTPARLLEQLALSESVDVRIAVADNSSTPTDLLSALARDDNADVRYAIAENHNIDREILALLREDDNPYVADRARRTLDRLSAGELVHAKFDARQVKIRAI
jgi:hypothetical protein